MSVSARLSATTALREALLSGAETESEGLEAIAEGVRRGADLSAASDEWGAADPLARAIERGWPRAVQALLDAGAPMEGDPLLPEDDAVPVSPAWSLPIAICCLVEVMRKATEERDDGCLDPPDGAAFRHAAVIRTLLAAGANPASQDPFVLKSALGLWADDLGEIVEDIDLDSGMEALAFDVTEALLDAWPVEIGHTNTPWREEFLEGRWNEHPALRVIVPHALLGKAWQARLRANLLNEKLEDPMPRKLRPRI